MTSLFFTIFNPKGFCLSLPSNIPFTLKMTNSQESLSSFMRGLLGQNLATIEIVDDNAALPTQSLCTRQRRRQMRRQKKLRKHIRSSSSSPCVLTRKCLDGKRSQWQQNQQETKSYSFESPVHKKATWTYDTANGTSCSLQHDVSPTSVLNPLSPKSARWCPHETASLLLTTTPTKSEEGLNTLCSPRSARWRTMQPSLQRQESDSFLIRPERVIDIPVCTP